MAKYLKLFMVALFATMSFSLVSCGDDDKPSDGNIIGTWKTEIKLDDDWWSVEYLRFNEDGTYDEVSVISFMDDIDTNTYSGLWSKNGNKLKFDDTTATIKEVSSKKLVLIVEGVEGVYVKCPDSEMDKYLK